MDLGERMKMYELSQENFLVRRMPYIIRVDGKNFHQWTRKVQATKPFDSRLMYLFQYATYETLKTMSGSVMAYLQSDEVSFLLQDYDTIHTEPWFSKRVQKLTSITASLFTAHFNQLARALFFEPLAFFDARVFVIPKEDVINYFVWRQQDATRNSIQAVGQKYFSPRALRHLKNSEVQEKLWQEAKVNWSDFPTWQKRGFVIYRNKERNKETRGWTIDDEIPIFSQQREYFQRFVPELYEKH